MSKGIEKRIIIEKEERKRRMCQIFVSFYHIVVLLIFVLILHGCNRKCLGEGNRGCTKREY